MNKLLISLCCLMLFVLTNCSDDIPEVKDNIYSAEDNSHAETQFYATFDAAFDIIATDKKFRKSETTIIPSTAKIDFLDTSFADGDGVEMTIDFGKLGEEEPRGILCQDGRYRAGKMHIKLNQSLLSSEFRATVTLSEEDEFYSGNGVDMAQLIGKTHISLAGISGIRVSVKDAIIRYEDNEVEWNSERIVTQIVDGSDGIWGDTYSVVGEASGVNRDGESFTVTIDEPLIKVVEKGCAKTFVSGVLTVSATNSSQVISIDYDPYKNGDCDQYAEASINGKKSIFKVY